MQSTVLEFLVNKLDIRVITNNLTDKDFSQFSWLNEREPIYNNFGERLTKSYYYQNTKEVIRIEYSKVFFNYEHDKIIYNNVLVGIQKKIIWLFWDGTASPYQKLKDVYMFNLKPVYNDNGTIITFSSLKQLELLQNERKKVLSIINFKCFNNYSFLANNLPFFWDFYKLQLNKWITTGSAIDFINSIQNVNDPLIKQILMTPFENLENFKIYLLTYIK